MEISVDVNIPETPLFNGTASRIVTEQLTADTEYAVNAIKGEAMPLTPVGATGLARGAWQTSVNVGGAEAAVLGRVFNLMGYAVPLERGAKPHWPPRGALDLWVRRKLGVPEKQVRSVAFLIARKIAQRGTSGHAMAFKALERAEPKIQARFRAGLAAIAQRLGR
jgi:hypothetical protein